MTTPGNVGISSTYIVCAVATNYVSSAVGGKEKILRKTVTYELVETPITELLRQTTFSTKPKIRRKHEKLLIVRERCEDLIELQYPLREVGYDKLRMDMMMKLGLCDRTTVLAYLGRPQHLNFHRVNHEVRYLRSQTIVLKEHTFKQKVPGKKGYLEFFGLATMFSENGKTYFQIHYENSNRPYHYNESLCHLQPSEEKISPSNSPLQECDESKEHSVPKKTSLSPIIAVKGCGETDENSIRGEVEKKERES